MLRRLLRKKYQYHIPCSFTYKVVCVDDDLLFIEVKMQLMNFIKAIFKEYKFCKKVINKHFNKDLVMSEKEEHLFEQSSSCWICEKLIDNDEEKVTDHCHVTGKFRGAAHWNCNVDFQLTKNVPAIFHNLRGYGSHLIFKIDVVPNGLEKHMVFFSNKNLVFIDSMQFMNSSLYKLVKKLSDEDFKYLIEEFGSKNLELLTQKCDYPYEYMNSFERFNKGKLPARKYFYSSTKNW